MGNKSFHPHMCRKIHLVSQDMLFNYSIHDRIQYAKCIALSLCGKSQYNAWYKRRQTLSYSIVWHCLNIHLLHSTKTFSTECDALQETKPVSCTGAQKYHPDIFLCLVG